LCRAKIQTRLAKIKINEKLNDYQTLQKVWVVSLCHKQLFTSENALGTLLAITEATNLGEQIKWVIKR